MSALTQIPHPPLIRHLNQLIIIFTRMLLPPSRRRGPRPRLALKRGVAVAEDRLAQELDAVRCMLQLRPSEGSELFVGGSKTGCED